MKKYFIAQGTHTVAEFDTLDDMIRYHADMNHLDRHFCKLYDRSRQVVADGCDILAHGEAAWQKW